MLRSFIWPISFALSAIAPTFADAQTIENTEALLAEIEARQAQRQDACLQTFLRAPTELGDVAMAEFGECDLAAARIAKAELDALATGMSARMAELAAEQAQLDAFLATLQRLQLVAIERDNVEVQKQVGRLQTEVAALNASTAELEAETDRFRALSAQYEAQIECIWDNIARSASDDCDDPTIWRGFLAEP